MIDVMVRKAQYLEPAFCQEGIADTTPGEPFRHCMLVAVDFDDQASTQTGKIRDIATDQNLAADVDPSGRNARSCCQSLTSCKVSFLRNGLACFPTPLGPGTSPPLPLSSRRR